MKKFAIALGTCLSFVSTALAAVPNDFDGDGISDRTWIQIESDKTLAWNVQLSTSQAQASLGSLGKSGDAVAMAQWLAGGTQIGVASLNSVTKEIEWSIRDSAGAVRTKVLGKKGDLVVSGADLDGNGIADAAVVRLEGKKATWVVKFDFFASDAPVEKTFQFGEAGDRVFYARAETGSAVDWIGITRTGSNSKTLARMMDINSGAVKQFDRLPKFASQGVRPRPFPIRQSSGADLIGFSVGSGGKTSVKVFSLEGGAISSSVFEGLGVSVVGEFLQGPGYEVLYDDGTNADILNPRLIDVTETVSLGGVPVDEININSLGLEVTSPIPTSTPTGGSGDDSGGGGTNSGPGLSSKCGSIVKWPGSHIYKTLGSKHFSDVRRNTIGVVIKSGGQGPFPSCLDALDQNGNVVAKLGLFSMGAGWAARYYAGVRCATSTPYGGAQVASRAMSSSGSSKIYMKFNNVCYGPIEASRCVGSTSC
jgi:hypothetical protein